MIMRLIGEDIRLQTVCGRGLPPVCFDALQLEQVILNLAVNARDAMPHGGRLTIETSYLGSASDDEDALSGRPVLLTFSDNGAGMTDDVRAHLFEPFFTTKEAGRGTGLGLAMVYGAVQQNGGQIQVQSELGQGSLFKICLPAATTGVPPALSQHARAPLARTRRASILLVEDHSKVAAFAKAVLEGLGHTVHAFPDAESALRALASLQPVPELLISDLVMPGMDGRTLAANAVQRLPGLRVLFVSGYAHDVIAERGIVAQGIEFLPKPYSAEQLAARLHELLQ